MALEKILILSFLLVIIQLTIPMLIDLLTGNTNLKYLLSSRDTSSKPSFTHKEQTEHQEIYWKHYQFLLVLLFYRLLEKLIILLLLCYG